MLLSCLLIVQSVPVGIAADLAYGEYLAGECVACHRSDAESSIPPIDTLPAPYFVEALMEYRNGERDHELMRTVRPLASARRRWKPSPPTSNRPAKPTSSVTATRVLH